VIFAGNALPFTTHTELTDESLFRFGLLLQHTGAQVHRTGLTDVRSHEAFVPLLAEWAAQAYIASPKRRACQRWPTCFHLARDPASGGRTHGWFIGEYGGISCWPDDSLALVPTNDNAGPSAYAAISGITIVVAGCSGATIVA